jgi:putative addiction module CopG family antidote
MTVEIPSEFQQFVHQVIDSGSYQSEEAVVGEALRLLQHRQQRLEELRREIQPALDGLDRGEGVIELDDSELDAFFAEIEALSEAQLAAEQKSQ